MSNVVVSRRLVKGVLTLFLTAAAPVSVSLTNATVAVVISGSITNPPAALPISWQLTDGELV
jgi:hypothetical protein